MRLTTFLQASSLLILLTACLTFSSCDDETGSVGIEVMPHTDQTSTSQTAYSVLTKSVAVDSIVSYSSECYLGRATDPETNATTTADFLAQFATLEDDDLPHFDSICKEDGLPVADSIVLNLYIKDYYGDSVNSMVLGIYELDSVNVLPEEQRLYTNIDPTDYISTKDDAIKKETTFAVVDFNIDNSVRLASSYSKNIRVVLPREYGNKIIRKFYEHPEYFKNSYSFIRHVVPGFYFKILAGNGTMVNIDISTLTLFFRYTANGKINNGAKRVAATSEVIQCNRLENKNIQSLLDATDYTYIKSPAAIFTEVTLPVDSIYLNHENDSINSARIVFQRYNNDLSTDYSLPIPAKLLMVRKGMLHQFFEQRQVPDNKTSFTADFSATYNSYTFNNIASLITYLYKQRDSEAGVKATDSKNAKESKRAAWQAANPDWAKVLLVPIKTSTGSTGSVVNVLNDFSLSSTKLLGSDNNPLSITIVYSSFTR